MNNLYLNLTYLLDEMAPYKKLTKKELKLKQKPWITKEILGDIYKRDQLLHSYQKEIDLEKKTTIF